jgi:hypothetical protein
MNVEDAAALLFGRASRFRLAAWIAGLPEGTFYQGEAVKGVDDSPNAVLQELNRLTRLGMLIKQPRLSGERRQYYSRTDSRLWQIIREALDAFEDEVAAGRLASPRGSVDSA